MNVILFQYSISVSFILLNPFHAEFLKWHNPSSIFGIVHYHFKGYQDGNMKMVSQQYRAWSDCTDVQVGLALYWWQRLLIIGVGRIRVKISVNFILLNILQFNKIICSTICEFNQTEPATFAILGFFQGFFFSVFNKQ